MRRRLPAALLAVVYLVVGGWLTVAPRAFYDSFPGFGQRWVSPLGAYSEHAFSDYGHAVLALAALCVAGAVRREWARLACGITLVESVPHLAYHLSETGALSTGANVAELLSLAIPVVLGVVGVSGRERS